MLHLYELRKQTKKSQTITAHLIGVHLNVYQRWESQETNPRWEQAIKIAEYFDVSLDYLAGLTDNPKSHKIGR